MNLMILGFIIAGVILVAVPLHVYFVMIPHAKEAAAHGTMGPNYAREYLKERGCYETMMGIQCFPVDERGCYETALGMRCLPWLDRTR